jgi:hypothetical protein
VFTVTNGKGAPARWTSSKKMNWSVTGRPWPPYSVGQPIPSQPSCPSLPTSVRNSELFSPAEPSSARTSGVIISSK